MEIGTLLSVGWNIVRVLSNLDPQKLEEAIENPDYTFTETEKAMIKALQTAFQREFSGETPPPELRYKEVGKDCKPIYTFPEEYNPTLIKLGSNRSPHFVLRQSIPTSEED